MKFPFPVKDCEENGKQRVCLLISVFSLTLKSTSFPSKSYRDAPLDVTSDASCRAALRSEI